MLGGGPAGLAAARGAARLGRSVLLVERAPVVGGMAASFDVAGVRVDHGSHRLHPAADPAVLADVRGLLGADLQTRVRNGRIALEGRWVAFPLRLPDLVRRLPPSFAASALVDQVRRRPPATRDTFADVVVERLGPTMGERFYFPYARKLWGLEPDRLSGEQARRRISAGGSGALVRRVLRPARPVFLYPRGGFGRIVEALADDASRCGASIRTGVAATAVGAGGRVALDDGTEVDADRVWSTVPLPALARLAGAPSDVLDAAARLDQRAMVLVYLVVDRPRWTPFDAHYLPGPSTPVTRVSEPKNYRDDPADPPDRTVLCAEIPCAVGDGVWTADDGTLGERVAADLAALGLPAVAPSHVEVRRLPAAYPVYRVGFEADLAPVEAWASAQPRLLSFGRLGLFAHDNTHHALAEARAAVGTLTGEVDWSAARAAFAAHVVED